MRGEKSLYEKSSDRDEGTRVTGGVSSSEEMDGIDEGKRVMGETSVKKGGSAEEVVRVVLEGKVVGAGTVSLNNI